jgi:hypothetical protein
MRLLNCCLTVVALFLFSSCAPLPPLNFSVPDVGVSEHKINAELKSMTVTIARPDEKTGDLPAGMEQMVPQMWQTALTEALNKMAIFQDEATSKVNVSVKILKLSPPNAGFAMTTESEARYEITDRKTGAIIFTQDIAASGTTPMDYAFVGIIRVRESINRAVQNNISQFLQTLGTVDVNKPMFPVKTAASK